MERSSDHSDLATALAETRPAPSEDFARKLDKRVAAGFPRRSRPRDTPLSLLRDHLLVSGPGRLLFAGGGVVLVTIAVATVILAGVSETEQSSRGGLLNDVSKFSESSESAPQPARRESPARAGHAPAGANTSGASESMEAEGSHTQYGPALSPTFEPKSIAGSAAATAGRAHRDIERSAEIGLLADPADVADDSAAVFDAVHDAHGIVLHSTTTSGKRAGADFDLLIPSARLGDALAAFSAIDEVGSRHEATEDITAPTVSANEKLRDSRARIDGLLAQLSAAETETEMAAIEAELSREHRRAASLRAQLDKLEQRTEFSRVSVRIKASGSSTDSDGAWGISDAVGNAGHILGVAAGVALIGLAILGPIALLCLLAWLGQRAWIRTQRKRVLRNL
jgi:Domain of unknown function (DUF4349)